MSFWGPAHGLDDDGGTRLHVMDLPQLYQRPSASALLDALSLLKLRNQGFGLPLNDTTNTSSPPINEEGVPKYLTGIVGNSLAWISDAERETIWDVASQRLSERSGRSGMGNISRTFSINGKEENFSISIYEPALTEDNLGLKTWGSALVLANNLCTFDFHVTPPESGKIYFLELGSGTGLVGIAAAAIFRCKALLTDLPEIVPNLSRNVKMNSTVLSQRDASIICGVLDWRQPELIECADQANCHEAEKMMYILAADPIYSPEHPSMFASTVLRWLEKSANSRLFLAYPLRTEFSEDFTNLRRHLLTGGLQIEKQKEEIGVDDWKHEVQYSISIWRWGLID